MEDYQKALEHIFTYGHGCCAFKHNIHGDWPGIPDGMPDSVDPLSPEFFCKSGVPLGPTTVKAKAVEVHLVEEAKGPGRGCRCRGARLTNSLILVLVIL